jgi:poly(3-hydroxybutyrate) depolymerase
MYKSPKHSEVKTLALLAFICFTLSVDVLAQEAKALPVPEIVSKQTIDGRRVIRYEHKSNKQWGYNKTQKDYFYVVPAKSKIKNAPLRVVLHSAGHSGDKVLADAFKHHDWFHYYGSEDYHILYLDCRKNKITDWWWGYHEIRRHPDLYKNKLSPTEARVLSTVEWVIQKYHADRNRVYLSGISMGGSGSLGIGLCRGDIFAAISVAVPAGVEHMEFRMANGKHQDPPPLFNISSHTDKWARGQERLLAYCEKNKYPIVFAWGQFGHRSDVSVANSAVHKFPWLSIRKNEAYPVFTGSSTDDRYPGFLNKEAPDQKGQINGYFRWKNIEDTKNMFVMELRLIKSEELGNAIKPPRRATTDVTMRRLQQFRVTPGAKLEWNMVRAGKVLQSGKVLADANGIVTVPDVTVTDSPSQLKIETDK